MKPQAGIGRLLLVAVLAVALGMFLGVQFKEFILAAYMTAVTALLAIGDRK
ncbi:hypothetical protein [Deinococcus petrolearius]|uniref:DUF2892 domain-containing protein n=1 Tax=Deinococcus petrolearius TaxID=1751295 RepID=A0ABW1DEH6_9DEIO